MNWREIWRGLKRFASPDYGEPSPRPQMTLTPWGFQPTPGDCGAFVSRNDGHHDCTLPHGHGGDHVYRSDCMAKVRASLESRTGDWNYVREQLREREAAYDSLRAEQRRWYLPDGSFEELEPEEVLRRRKAAAVELAYWEDPESERRQGLEEEIIFNLGEGSRSEIDLREGQLDATEAALAAATKRAEKAEKVLAAAALEIGGYFVAAGLGDGADSSTLEDWIRARLKVKAERDAALERAERAEGRE